LYCLSFFCSSFDHCIVCPSFVLLLTIVLYILLRFELLDSHTLPFKYIMAQRILQISNTSTKITTT
jgi:hypothetical protein